MKNLIFVLFLLFLSLIYSSKIEAKEGENPPVSDAVIKIDYKMELLSVIPEDNEIKKIYFAKIVKNDKTISDKIKIWEEASIKDEEALIDISSFISAKDSYLAIKLENSNKVNGIVKIAAQPKIKLAKDFDITTGDILLADSKDKTKLIPAEQIEIKKEKRGYWQEWDSFSLEEKEEQIALWRKMGTVIYARAMAIDGEEDNDQSGMPASNEVLIKIKKLANPPRLVIDGNKLMIKMKKGTEYRINDESGTSDENWISVLDTNIKEVSLYELTQTAIEEGSAVSEDITIEYRTTKPSKINTVKLKAQGDAPIIGKEIIVKKKSFISHLKTVTNMAIQVYNPEKDFDGNNRIYEYLIVKDGELEWNDLTKGWKTLTEKEVRLREGKNKSQIAEGDKILFRAKMVRENRQKQRTFQLPSAYTEYIISNLSDE